MVDIRSVSKPEGALESAAVDTRRVIEGTPGKRRYEGDNRAAKRLLVTGKSNQATSALESVIGADDRTRILETAADPWRMICALRIKSPFGTFVGTGWFAGPKTIVTAGHCVYDEVEMGGWAAEIEVSPGRDGQELPFGSVSSKRFSTLSLWKETRDPDFDVGAIHLPTAAGVETGTFGIAAFPAGELEGFQVNISGYPADLGRGTQQWFHANRVLRVSPRRVFYDIDTFGGQSGSPVWIHENDGAPPIVVGIHAYGVGGTPDEFGITANSAPRILPEVLDIVDGWVQQDSGS